MAHAEEVTVPHRIAACNLLTSLVERCSSSASEAVKTLVWESNVWTRCFDIVLYRAHSTKPKPLRQLLSALGLALSRSRQLDAATTTEDDALQLLVTILLASRPQTSTRPALQAITFFLQKDQIDFSKLRRTYLQKKGFDHLSSDVFFCSEVLKDTLRWTRYDDISSSAASLVLVWIDQIRSRQDSCSTHDSACGCVGQSVWIGPALNILSENTDELETFEHYVLPVLLRNDCLLYTSPSPRD